MDLPERKRNRLDHFDYSQNGAYFITICTKKRQNLFWNVGERNARPNSDYKLSPYGNITDDAIKHISGLYNSVTVDKYVIMPNHIHMILLINKNGSAMRSPTTISTVINQFKGFITKQIGCSIWQKSFYDHIIRNTEDYQNIWQYIDNNPLKWQNDCFYVNMDRPAGV